MEDDEASASPPLPWMQNKSAAAIEASSGPLSAVASRLSARSRALPSSRDFHFYINLPAFKSSVGAVAAKADASLGVLDKFKALRQKEETSGRRAALQAAGDGFQVECELAAGGERVQVCVEGGRCVDGFGAGGQDRGVGL
uniref:Uncharacterized protein n=1 Tax=Zea mays TaxID=4577 RepID=A0A804MBS5_MAIZE